MRPHTYRTQLARPACMDFTDVKLPMREVAARYGLEVDRHGRCLCPFHADHTPSMTLYDGVRGWYCWVCGEGGDSVDFVKKLFHLPTADAANKLREDFGLCAPVGGESKSDYLSRREAEDAGLSALRSAYNANILELSYLIRILDYLVPTYGNGGAIGQAMARKEYLEYWFYENPWR